MTIDPKLNQDSAVGSETPRTDALITEYRGVRRSDFAPNICNHARQLERSLTAATERAEQLAKLVYVPGVLRCAKCKLVLVSTIIDANSGNMAANNDPQQCPNGCGPLWRQTERDAGNELCDRLDKEHERAEQLQAECERLRKAAERYRLKINNQRKELRRLNKYLGPYWSGFSKGLGMEAECRLRGIMNAAVGHDKVHAAEHAALDAAKETGNEG